MLSFLSNNKGGLSRAQLFWIIVLSTGGYFGYHFIPMYFKHYMMKEEVISELKIAHHYTDEEIVSRLMERTIVWNVPVLEKNIRVHRDEDAVFIKIEYKIVKVLLDKKKRTFYYVIEDSMGLQDRRTLL